LSRRKIVRKPARGWGQSQTNSQRDSELLQEEKRSEKTRNTFWWIPRRPRLRTNVLRASKEGERNADGTSDKRQHLPGGRMWLLGGCEGENKRFQAEERESFYLPKTLSVSPEFRAHKTLLWGGGKAPRLNVRQPGGLPGPTVGSRWEKGEAFLRSIRRQQGRGQKGRKGKLGSMEQKELLAAKKVRKN